LHPNGTAAVYPVERLTKLYDSMEQLEDGVFEDEVEDDHRGYNEEEIWAMDHDGVWQPHNHDDDDEWEEMDDDEGDTMDVDAPGWDTEQPAESAMDVVATPQPRVSPPQQENVSVQTSPLQTPSPTIVDDGEFDGATAQWKRFDVLASAPPDHAFYSSPPANPSKAFLGRLTKEYRVLASSLPECILVRAFEDRTDLLRSVIIGPQNTPYQDAPFVIDWMLDSNFPQSPPIAHFLSWTNGNGRVNP
jgi:ubiquitin-conjugating enzyme E2 O